MAKHHIIGFMHPGGAATFADVYASFAAALQNNLTPGDTVEYDTRWGEGDYSAQWRMTTAKDLASKYEMIVAPGGAVTGAAAVAAAAFANNNVHVIFTSGGDLTDIDQLGLSPSNTTGVVTGVVMGTTDSAPQRINKFRQLVGNYPEIAYFLRSGTKVYYEELKFATQQNLIPINATNFLNAQKLVNFDDMFNEAIKHSAVAVAVCADPSFTHQRLDIINAANRYSMPVVYPFKLYYDSGGLLSIGPNLLNIYAQVGLLAALVLNGAKQSDVPIYYATDLDVKLNFPILHRLRREGVIPLLLSDEQLASMFNTDP
jgi:putative ABC transport system substrate-binding protein